MPQVVSMCNLYLNDTEKSFFKQSAYNEIVKDGWGISGNVIYLEMASAQSRFNQIQEKASQMPTSSQ